MVAVAHHRCFVINWSVDSHWREFGSSSVYLHTFLIMPHLMTKEKNLETILTLCVALMIFYFVFDLKLLLKIAIVLGLIGMFSNYLSGKIAWAWMKLAEGMGYVMSKVLLTVVFFVFLFPIAILSRLLNKDKLQLRKTTFGSYYIERNHEFAKKDLENVW